MLEASKDPRDEFDLPADYEIRIRGRLDASWADWFGGLAISYAGDTITILSGTLVDQPALTGILNKLCELGLPLLSVTRLDRRDRNDTGRTCDA